MYVAWQRVQIPAESVMPKNRDTKSEMFKQIGIVMEQMQVQSAMRKWLAMQMLWLRSGMEKALGQKA